MIDDREIVSLIRDGFDTAPKMARHILSLPAEGSVRDIGCDAYNSYALHIKSIFRKLGRLARYRIVERAGMEGKEMTWRVVE